MYKRNGEIVRKQLGQTAQPPLSIFMLVGYLNALCYNFNVDESVMEKASAAFAQIALDWTI